MESLLGCSNIETMIIFKIFSLLLLNSFASNYTKDGKLIVSGHYSPPWSYRDCSGAELDIIRAAFKEVSIEIDCEITSYARLVKKFTQKKSLFASPVVKSEGEKVGAYYSSAFVHYVDVAVSYESSNISLKELADKKVSAYQKASLYLGSEFSKIMEKNKSYKEMPARDAQLKMLYLKRVDYVVGEKNILHNLSKALYPRKKLYNNIVLKKWDIRAGSPDKELMKKFNKGLSIIKKKGQIREIYKRYGIID